MDVGMVFRMVARPEGSEIPYRNQGVGSPNSRFWDQNLNPCQKPPWGFLTAIDLDNGTFRWRSVLGVVDELIGQGLPPTGAPNLGGSLVTAGGLVFIGATNDSRFRAFDKATGKELWVTRLPASAHATPMTFKGRRSGRQFVVIAAGGGNKYNKTFSDALIAFALPGGTDNAEPLVSYSKATAREAAAVTRPPAPAATPELFSHKRHGALKLDCVTCHSSATTGERAGFPAASACMNCHKGAVSQKPEIQRLAAMSPAQKVVPASPIYHLPDFIFFRHRQHVHAGGTCVTCHGDVWAQEQIQPILQMKMKACVDCHQANRASVTCTVCHELSQ
jgi:quinoprotein glucose dehydrogenase